jgi:ABC-type multidrug transport system fused ATPase/permease subunit
MVLIDGVDLQKIKLQSLRRLISIATQEPLLFDLSLKDNISYGLKDISLREIEEVTRLVQLDDFVRQLPKRYDTVIGENACQLSQGYKQRVALARAIIRNPALLILDEATSSVDSLTEEKIFLALREKRRGRSTLVISHRLFSIKDADVIYFLRPQGLVEEGRHEELLTKSPEYKEFFHNQLEGSEAELGIKIP